MRHALLASLCIAISLPVCAAEWRSTEGSEFTFEVTFEGEPILGEFRDFDVNLDFDPACLDSARLRVTVDLRAADMGDPDMNDVLFDPAWFDVQQFNEAVFVSDAITEQSPGEFIATGTLDLKGTVRSVAAPFSWTRSEDQATMQGGLVLKRTDFDVGSGEWATDDAIGIDVTLDFTVQLLAKE